MDVWKQFEENGLTHSAAHHLLAIIELKEKRGYARVTDVARLLNITTGSASTNLKILRQKNLVIEDENRFLSLSQEGEGLAQFVIARKGLFLKFFKDVLGVSEEQADIDSCKIEHLVGAETTQKLQHFLNQYSK
jgi:DtxR family Mn-dependent transcriptional regulator